MSPLRYLEISRQRANRKRTEKYEVIFEDLITAFDEAMATFNVFLSLENSDDQKKPNQLLFCHIVNSFDSFLDKIYAEVVFNSLKLSKHYLEKRRKKNNGSLNDSVTLKEIINIEEGGVQSWIKNEARQQVDVDIKNQRNYEKIETLFKNLEIPKKYVYLSGQSGCLKNTKIKNKTTNHRTFPEDLFGFADVIYEKRNAITHNKNKYSEKTLARLNGKWKIDIQNRVVLVKGDSIKTAVRFYTSVALLIIEYLNTNISKQIKTDLNNLRDFNTLEHRYGNGHKPGYQWKDRWEKFLETSKEEFTYDKYIKEFPNICDSTRRRDLKKLIDDGKIKKNGKTGYKTLYKIVY